jgi:RNA polymerase sigma-70 factor (ECF subfamily)
MVIDVRQPEAAAAALSSSFYALYDREALVVMRYLRSAVRDRALAEDLCGDAFCKAWDAWPRFHGGEPEARAWLMRIARNLVIDRVRRDGRVKFEALPEPGMVATPDPTDTSAGSLDLRRAMGRLGRDDRELLALRVAGLSHAEIAAVQGRSEEAVKKAWQRALAQLRAQLENDA